MEKGINPVWISAILTAGIIGAGICTAIDSKKHGNSQPATPDAGVVLRKAKDAAVDATRDAARDVPMALEELSGMVQATLPQKATAAFCDLAKRNCIK